VAYAKGHILDELRDPLIGALVMDPVHEAEDEHESSAGAGATASAGAVAGAATEVVTEQLPVVDGIPAEAHTVTVRAPDEKSDASDAAAAAVAPAAEDAYAWERFRNWWAAGKRAKAA
jgi:hypothetical protein